MTTATRHFDQKIKRRPSQWAEVARAASPDRATIARRRDDQRTAARRSKAASRLSAWE